MGFATRGNRFLRRHCRPIALMARAAISKTHDRNNCNQPMFAYVSAKGQVTRRASFMPVFRYFAFVGGALLALLLILNWSLPSLNADGTQDSVDRSIIRIH